MHRSIEQLSAQRPRKPITCGVPRRAPLTRHSHQTSRFPSSSNHIALLKNPKDNSTRITEIPIQHMNQVPGAAISLNLFRCRAVLSFTASSQLSNSIISSRTRQIRNYLIWCSWFLRIFTTEEGPARFLSDENNNQQMSPRIRVVTIAKAYKVKVPSKSNEQLHSPALHNVLFSEKSDSDQQLAVRCKLPNSTVYFHRSRS